MTDATHELFFSLGAARSIDGGLRFFFHVRNGAFFDD